MKIKSMINSQRSDLRLSHKINFRLFRAVPLTCTCGVRAVVFKIVDLPVRNPCGIRAVPLTCTCGVRAGSVRGF